MVKGGWCAPADLHSSSGCGGWGCLNVGDGGCSGGVDGAEQGGGGGGRGGGGGAAGEVDRAWVSRSERGWVALVWF